MKQAARCWNKAIVELFKNSGYFESDADPCIYYKHVEESFVIAAVYVDDFLIVSNDTELLTLKKKRLRKRFDMEDQGKVHYWFSLSSKQNRKQGVLTINQGAYLTSVLNRFGMSDCNSAATPTEPGKRFNKIAGNEDPVNITEYHSAIGCLIYASIATRTDFVTSHEEKERFIFRATLMQTGLVRCNKKINTRVPVQSRSCTIFMDLKAPISSRLIIS